LVFKSDARIEEPVSPADTPVLRLVEITDGQVRLPVFLAHDNGVMEVVSNVVSSEFIPFQDVGENFVVDPWNVDFEVFSKEFRIVSVHNLLL